MTKNLNVKLLKVLLSCYGRTVPVIMIESLLYYVSNGSRLVEKPISVQQLNNNALGAHPTRFLTNTIMHPESDCFVSEYLAK